MVNKETYVLHIWIASLLQEYCSEPYPVKKVSQLIINIQHLVILKNNLKNGFVV